LDIQENRGISPVITTVIIVAVGIAVAIATALWMNGLVSTFTRFERLEIISAYAIPTQDGCNVYVTIKNTGSSDATITSILINGIPISSSEISGISLVNPSSLPFHINVGNTTCFIISISSNNKVGSGKLISGVTANFDFHTAAGRDYLTSLMLSVSGIVSSQQPPQQPQLPSQPLRFQDPSTSGVSVVLSNDNTTAVVSTTTSISLVLDTRNAFIYDDFLTNPFTDKRLINNTNSWSWNPAGYISVSADGPSGSWGGEQVAYYSTTVPSNTRVIYVLSKESHFTSAEYQHMGLLMIYSEKSFYTLEYYSSASVRNLQMYSYTGSWNSISSQTVSKLTDKSWFIFFGSRVVSSGLMNLTVYDSNGNKQGSLSGSDTGITVSKVGLGIRDETSSGKPLKVDFDDFIASADANPLFINVTNLNSGWTVYLEDSSGNVLTSATADSSGKASLRLNINTGWIIRNGRLRIMNGSTIIISKSFDVIVGGDVYKCISVLTDKNLLAYHNFDNKAYNVYLKLESYSIKGNVYSLNLWVSSGTTPIQIVNNSVIQDTTSSILLSSNSTNYIHGNATLSPSSTITLNLSFHYYIPSSGVEVTYPVKVTING